MEDYLIREIDRIGEMLLMIAKRLGIHIGPDAILPLRQIDKVIAESGLSIDINMILSLENPIIYLVEKKEFSDKALETFTELILHSYVSDEIKHSFLKSVITYLDNKGYYSFTLHSY